MTIITIDGVDIKASDNKRVLDWALEAGIYIPHLCHHPNLSDLGSCGMCIVEVEGKEGVVRSCMLSPKDGMKIHTNGEEVKRLRMLALELILAGHPEECTSCPKYGNCELQVLIQYIGPKTGRMHMRTKGFKTQDENPMFIHDMNRCVLCGRCVRACNELRGVKVIQYQKKDMETYVGTLHNKLLIDADCRFCGACAEVCPTGSIRDKIQLLDMDRKKEDAIVPCRYACPAHTDVPRYISFAKEGKYDEAAAVIREKVPFPKTLGYICNHVCEAECNRGEINEPISIREIKRYITEKDSGSYWKGKGKQLPDTGKKVCVIGAGPAGLSAAYYLRKQGHEVTIKEEQADIGGMMRYGIPEYRLPGEIIEQEVKVILETGIRIQTNKKVEKPKELLNQYDAVLISVGGHKGIRLPIEGAELEGVLLNTDFLRLAAKNEPTGMGKHVVVLGGGNVAFDCARTAKRLGATEVHLACLEDLETIPADSEEIEQAKEEGINIHLGKTFERIIGTSTVVGVDLMQVKSFTFTDEGKAVIEKEENSEHTIKADTVIFAVGQRPNITEEIGVDLDGSFIKVNASLATSQKGIFAAGDVIYGTDSVVKAIASGREVASQIDQYLGGDGDITEVLAPKQQYNAHMGNCPGFGYQERVKGKVSEPDTREKNFELVNLGITNEGLCAEASRCLQCDLRLQISEPRTWADYSDRKEVID